ncbi:HD-GYP domain-containing protein [Bacillus sp. V3B]|uniref:HD-GYP domain-containing protein n=1 Tax=Bacillus sp. V3B TaxID=2804915 RepID=UPI00210DA103|nr:HD-GYP domain-containing protein [Bacillus sp. V3B]MCQ6276638.1 HD-GYP domain-containing protein [Bacillus sp. V3B]
MRVKVKDLLAGCILTEDVFGLTARPIVQKNTVLTAELIEILNLFLVPSVKVDKTLVTGMPFLPLEVMEDENKDILDDREKKGFTGLFLESTQEYKKQFQSWQSGLSINISKIREVLLPLLDEGKLRSIEIFSLHHLSNNEEYQYQHAVAVGLLCGFMARKLNYSKGEVIQAALAGILADCGMVKVRPGISQKKSALTPQEFEEIKKHSNYSYEMVQQITSLKESTKVSIIQHHERLDGSGYPFGLNSNQIHPVAKLIGVADTYHAMTSERLYRKKQSPFRVLELMRQDYFGQFDLSALKALSEGIINFSIGSKVRLSNGKLGEVLFITEKSPTRPLIKLTETEEMMNLEEHLDLFIEEIIFEESFK